MRLLRFTASRHAAVRAALVALCVSVCGVTPAAADALSPDDQARLDHLLRHDCGSCHGMTMKGGLGPPLLPETLRDRDEETLVQFILAGNPARAMPPWHGLLSAAEARWIVRRLMRGAPEEGTQK